MDTVLFAGYKIPHPLEPRFLIKIQTTSDTTPIQVVQEACKALILLLSKLKEEFIKEFDAAKAMGGVVGPQAGMAGAGMGEQGMAATAQDEGMQGYSGAGFLDEGMGDY